MNHRQHIPRLDTSAEHNHPIDSTHNPTQGRSLSEEYRRTSAGEILLSETDVAWFNLAAGSQISDDTSVPLAPSNTSLGAEYVVRKRRNSFYGSVCAGNQSSTGSINTSNTPNTASKLHTKSSLWSPVMPGSGNERDKSDKSDKMEE
ncbi:hypothetical protein TWF694_005645 [Orbilia ellipsospora]|uniref:Uncharacterized protein n=1 Tax=Orbilia ellipsospora TaxID=2528407 RepID=A0AAV9WRR2_9PEZI